MKSDKIKQPIAIFNLNEALTYAEQDLKDQWEWYKEQMRRWDELNKKQKKHIREMAGVAYERAMVSALDNLLSSFQKWKHGNLTPFALDEEIHRYHNGTARDLYKLYGMGNQDMAVLIALAKGILKIEELDEDCRSFYQERVDRFRN